MKLIGSYINGNYRVSVFDDGTKVRENSLDFFSPATPESMDIKITNQCDCGCPYCHEDSKPDGQHGDILGAKFIETLHPYTELAIGGGNPLCHPDLEPFLHKCKDLRLIPSMTVNQNHFVSEFERIKRLCDDHLVYGLGVSLTRVTDDLLNKLAQIPNAVLHVINGVVDPDDLKKLYDRGLKLLILGYKEFRRGNQYFDANHGNVMANQKELYLGLKEMLDHFEVVSFDNLAIKQLTVKRLLGEEEWNEFYMGDDGQFTMYIDMVNQEYAVSSTSTERWPMADSIEPMFERVRTR